MRKLSKKDDSLVSALFGPLVPLEVGLCPLGWLDMVFVFSEPFAIRFSYLLPEKEI